MKKLLLLLVAAFFVAGAFAQHKTDAVKMDQKKVLEDVVGVRGEMPYQIDYSLKATSEVERIYVGEAHSQRSFRREDCKVIHYHPDLDIISISFMIDEETYPGVALSNGTAGIFYSEDHGDTWMGPVFTSDFSADGFRNYYLSGIAYNPTGNDVVENAYGIYMGVAPDDALAIWNSQAFGWSTLGGTNQDQFRFENEPGDPDHEHDGYFSQFGLTQKGDIVKGFNVYSEGGWSDFYAVDIEDIEGTFNGTGFDWDLEHSTVGVAMDVDPGDDNVLWSGMYVFADLGAELVWSDDAMTGYAWMIGATTENLEGTGFQPILYKTTDGGDTWDYIEIDFQESEWQDFFQNGATVGEDWLIFPCRAEENGPFLDFTIPWFNATVGAVDANGNLQMFGDVTAHYYDIFESVDFYENFFSRYNDPGELFKFTIGDELIDIMWVDSLQTAAAQDEPGGSNDSLYCLNNGWLRALQLAKDVRSEEFFLTWTDSPGLGGGLVGNNYTPDVKGWSYNVTTGENTETVNFTEGTLFSGFYWYVRTAEHAMYNADDSTFHVPMVNAVSFTDFANNTVASADPVDVDYVKGITFPAIVPISVGIDDNIAPANISVSQNMPNPATGTTSIEISSDRVAPVTVEISNLIGQTVYTQDAGLINGSMRVSMDISNLDAGVYIYTVTIGSERVSNRMIVK